MMAHDKYRDDLPLYAVGALTNEESEQIELHLTECSACRDELRNLSEAAAQIALAVEPATPPAHLREKLIAQLEDQPSVKLAPARGSRTRSSWFWTPAFAAAVLALTVVILWQHNSALHRENQELASQLETNGRVLSSARALIDTLTAADAQHVTLVAAGAKPQPEAKAVYSSRRHSLLLLAGNLNPLPAHKIYELWLLPANGSPPIPAGTFQPDARGSSTLAISQFAGSVAAKGFAVTIENEPGSATPTMPIILSGTT